MGEAISSLQAAKPPALAPTALVIFGAGGDLTWRKLTPALYRLFAQDWLPEHMAIVGVDRKTLSLEALRKQLQQGVERATGPLDTDRWQAFAGLIDAYIDGDFNDPKTYTQLDKTLSGLESRWATPVERIYYLATPPGLVETIVQRWDQSPLVKARARSRVVVEKPFGRDLESARALNHMLTQVFAEKQIFRIDHYLGKETVQNILAFRFANAMFEPIWDRRYIDHVQITVAETVGVEHRGGYYDKAGALRDMIQNHLMQILCLLAMEPPVSFQADEIRNKKLDVLQAIRRIPPDQMAKLAVRGQYGRGSLQGKDLPAYRQEPGIDPKSQTETFAALKLFIDNWRWHGVPFYLRTGKRLPERLSQAIVEFRPVPHRSFPASATTQWEPNRLLIRIQPQEGILLHFEAKEPGPEMCLQPVDMRFSYRDAFKKLPPDAYETLLLDVIQGDATLFMRADQVEEAWSVVMPVLNAWSQHAPGDFPNYPAGSWGPQAAEQLIARDGRAWITWPVMDGEGDSGAPDASPAGSPSA